MATIKELEASLQALQLKVNELEAKIESTNGRDRGPRSEGEMTEQDAIRCLLGDLRKVSHKQAAIQLKLSYGQIYSARKGYTFKKIYQRSIKGEFIDEPLNSIIDEPVDQPIDDNTFDIEA